MPRWLLRQRFDVDVQPGQMVGGPGRKRLSRPRVLGIDREAVVSADNGAARLVPAIIPGWGRQGLAWGPFPVRPGTLAVFTLLDGHNTSQAEPLSERFGNRIETWLRGPRRQMDVGHALRRLRTWAGSGRADRLARAMARWFFADERVRPTVAMDDNLAVGFFSSTAPADPTAFGPCFVMRGLGPENGALLVGNGYKRFSAVHGVQNLPLCLAVLLRAGGAVFYAASLPDVRGLPAWPLLRPLGVVDWVQECSPMFAGVHQSVLGQIGFRADTRIYGVDVMEDASLAKMDAGAMKRITGGAGVKITRLLTPAGLLISRSNRRDGSRGLVFRHDGRNAWSLRMANGRAMLFLTREDRDELIASAPVAERLVDGAMRTIQILDDGESIQAVADGNALFHPPVQDARLADATGVATWPLGPDGCEDLSDIEVHARSVCLPGVEEAFLPAPVSGRTRVLCQDAFRWPGAFRATSGAMSGRPLRGYASGLGFHWRRDIGQGDIWLDDQGARIQANTDCPSPDRTIYTIVWPDRAFADLSIDVLPPGTGRHQGEKCRAGFVFWQDDDNHIVISVYLDDHYGGASVSSFFHLRGFEDLYDAIWTNVGDRIVWGRLFNLRVVFDGRRYQAFVDGEAVLYRALTDVYSEQPPLEIRRVGLVSNWEWGEDTGSVIRNFCARGMSDVFETCRKDSIDPGDLRGSARAIDASTT